MTHSKLWTNPRKGPAAKLRLLPLAFIFGSGCGTISNMAGGNLFEKGPEAFGGVRQNAETMRQGGGHEGFNALIACMDMPFSLALDIVVFPVTLPIELLREPPPNAKSEAKLLRIHDRIQKSKTMSLKFTLEQPQPEPITANGTLLIKKGGKIRLELALQGGGKERKILYISDGKRAYGVIDGMPSSPDPSPELLEPMIRKILFSGGLLTNAWAPPGELSSLLKEPVLRTAVTESFFIREYAWNYHMRVSWSNVRSPERESDPEVLSYQLGIFPPKFEFDVELRYDPKTLAWVERVLRPREGSGTIHEKYEEFRFDGDIPDERFRLPE